MKRRLMIFMLLFLSSISCKAYSADNFLKKNYLYSLINDDHKILSKKDLIFYVTNVDSEPFSWKFSGEKYWQCFSTKDVRVSYDNLGYNEDEKSEMGDLTITVRNGQSVSQEYSLTRGKPKDYCMDKMRTWAALMKNEQYVCIGGHFVDVDKKIKNHVTKKIYGWIFSNIKTKKGCDGYFDDCPL